MYDVVLHWYQSEGTKVLSTGIKQNIQRFIGRVFSNRNDGGFVRVSVTTNADQIEEANKKVIFFQPKSAWSSAEILAFGKIVCWLLRNLLLLQFQK